MSDAGKGGSAGSCAARASRRWAWIRPPALIDHARALDPEGDYRIESAEALGFADAEFDLVVSYLSLIDIPDASAAIREMVRVLKPGGTLLIANLTSFNSAGDVAELGWTQIAGTPHPFCDGPLS